MRKIKNLTLSNKKEGKTDRCLEALLQGKRLNRKILGDLGIAMNNDSAHSMISELRNKKFIPIESSITSDRTCDYYMEPSEILRYKDKILRGQQCEEVRCFVFERRRQRLSQQLERAGVLLNKRNTSSNDD